MKSFKLYLWQLAINNIAGFVMMPIRIRALLYKLSGMNIQTKNFESNLKFYCNKISIGKGTYINSDCHFYNHANITIGERCFFAPQSLLLTISLEIGNERQRAGKFYAKPIVIENGVWVGARSIILPGVTIREGSIIAAGAVVDKNCEANGVYAGIPARRIKDLCTENQVVI